MCSTLGVRQQALQVGLADHERGRHHQREDAEREEERLHEGCLPRRRHDLRDPGQPQEGAARQGARHQGGHQAGGLAVGVRLPGVERREPHLGPESDEQKHERRPQQARLQGVRRPHQVLDQQRPSFHLRRRQEERSQ